MSNLCNGNGFAGRLKLQVAEMILHDRVYAGTCHERSSHIAYLDEAADLMREYASKHLGGRMAELSARLQSLVIMLCTSLYASRQEDELVRDAADVMCSELRRQFTGERASDGDFRRETQLGAAVVDGGFRSIAGLHPDEILMPYPPADK